MFLRSYFLSQSLNLSKNIEINFTLQLGLPDALKAMFDNEIINESIRVFRSCQR